MFQCSQRALYLSKRNQNDEKHDNNSSFVPSNLSV